jgi:uncharacterized protein involved in exopolysaccharide biosynthesis
MESQQPPKPALPLLVLLALASALGVAVAVALAGVAMLLAAPAYAGEGSLLLERRAGMAEARLVFAETESHEDGSVVRTRVLEEFHNPFAKQLAGIYLHRLPANAVLERLTFTVMSEDVKPVTAHHALFTLRAGAAVVERTAQIGPGETLLVELEYRTRSPRRVLALRGAVP